MPAEAEVDHNGQQEGKENSEPIKNEPAATSSSPETVRQPKVWTRPRSSIDEDVDASDLKVKLRKLQQNLKGVRPRKDPVGVTLKVVVASDCLDVRALKLTPELSKSNTSPQSR